ncbi:MAG: hypothetical protein AAGC60_25930 [Acidobacteriota bacterium]
MSTTETTHRPSPRSAWLRASLLSLAVLAMLAVPPSVAAGDEGAALGMMGDYLTLAERYTELASRPETSVFFAVEGIVEIYEARGELDQAVQHLERLLEKHSTSQTVRNIVRFKLRDLYNQTGRSQRALEELETVIEENAARPPAR